MALYAFKHLIHNNPKLADKVKLVIARGYDLKVNENVDHHIELMSLAKELEIENKVHFYRSITNTQRVYLMQNAVCVLYTPQN